MAILHADNFSIYGANSALMLEGVYGHVDCSLDLDPDGISPGRVLNTRGGNENTTESFRYILQNGPTPTVGVSFRAWLTGLPANNNSGKNIRVMDNDGAPLAEIYFTQTGQVSVKLNGGALYTTTIPVITAKGWYHCEFKYKANGGTCDFEFRIEGLNVLSRTAVAVVGSNPSYINGLSRNTNDDTYRLLLKDLVVWDGTGSRNNDFLGSVIVTTLTPQADVSLNWTPTGGVTGSGILDNVPPDNAAYISAADAPIPAPYVCTLTDLPDEVTSVKALISYVRAAKSDGGDGSLQASLISDADGTPATVNGADRPITVAQTYWRDVFEVDPKTGNAWIPADVNDVNFKINRTT